MLLKGSILVYDWFESFNPPLFFPLPCFVLLLGHETVDHRWDSHGSVQWQSWGAAPSHTGCQVNIKLKIKQHTNACLGAQWSVAGNDHSLVLAMCADLQETAVPGQEPPHRPDDQCRAHPPVRDLPGPGRLPSHSVRGLLGTDQHRFGDGCSDGCCGRGRGHPSFRQLGVIPSPAHLRAGRVGPGEHCRYLF